MADPDETSEAAYDAARLEQWLTGRARRDEMSRRGMLRMLGTAGLAAATLPAVPGTARGAAARSSASDGPIVKPLPADEFYLYGSNAEMRWEVMRGRGS